MENHYNAANVFQMTSYWGRDNGCVGRAVHGGRACLPSESLVWGAVFPRPRPPPPPLLILQG